MAINYSIINGIKYLSGTTAQRPAGAVNGATYFNTSTGALQIAQGGSWYTFQSITAPSAPTSVVATDSGSGRAYNNGAASVAFSPTTETGGFPTGFTVTSSPGSYTATGSSSPITITGLQSSTQYTYTVTANNSAGTSSSSSASSGVTTTTVPQAPTIGTATGGDTTATLTFTAGATGGSAITNYKWSTDGSTYTAFSPAQTSSPLSFTGLTNGNSYAWYLKAVNANGDSAASSISNSVIPAGSSVDLIERITVGAGGSSSISFSSIPSTYTHLQVRAIARSTTGGSYGTSWSVRYNSASSNYARHSLQGNGTSAAGDADTGQTYANFNYLCGGGVIANSFSPLILDILDYANTNKYKTTRSLAAWEANGDGAIAFASNLYQSTSAISQIDIVTGNGSNFAQYSSFALYGIKGA